MLGLRSQAGETVEDFCERYARIIKQVLAHHGEETWDSTYHRLHFSWAGHVFCIGQYDPDRVTFQVLMHKNWQWIQSVAAQNGGNQLHCRKLHTWRWEGPISRFFEGRGCIWEQKAVSELEWNQLLNEMVTWRCIHS